MKGNHHRNIALTALLGFGIISIPAQAEDIEVFFSKEASAVAPNVLFVLDTSGSMKDTEGGVARLDILKDSLRKVLKPGEEYYKALNVGIMDFSGHRSGGIDFPVADINGDAHDIDPGIPAGTDVSSVLDYISQSYTASGETPMGDALYFASNYFSGTQVFNSGGWRGWRNLPIPTWDTSTNSYTGGDREADNPAAYEGSIGYTYEARTGERNCSRPDDPNPRYRICADTPVSCSIRTGTTSARPHQYRTHTYSCDSSGLECRWDASRWTAGSASCGSRPPSPEDGDTWIECRAAREASSYSYERCRENYTYEARVWGPASIYKSPITHQCQSNHVVLLTDGEPTQRYTLHYIASRVRPITGSSSYHDCTDLSAFSGSSDKIPTYGRCLPELTKYMAEYDQATDLPGDQTVSTYTIGFRLTDNPSAQDFLKLLASNGKGNYFDADSSNDLADVFKRIIRDVTGSDISFSAPSVSVDQTNRLATNEYLYRSVFTPSDKPAWRGDIVKTRLSRNESGEAVFSDETTFASTLTASQRKIYTYVGTNKDLTDPSNAFTTGNDKLTADDLAVSSNERDNLIQWVRGQDVKDENGDTDTTDQRSHMGDSLHTAPALVDYASGSKQVLYVPTNDGLLHAFDISGGSPSEIFAFIPPELLPNFKRLYANSNTDTKVYGLDGNMAIWRSEDGEKTHLYLGMRRGGNNYYGLDISDPTKPKMLWTIKGGSGDFAELGQTWSTPQLTSVMADIDGTMTRTRVLIFGGGYDTNQDDEKSSPRTNDDSGRAIFIVNAETGEKIWSAGPGSDFDYDLKLRNSIPSDVRIIDLDSNGLADRLYVGDTGGRIWRVDLDQADIGNSSGYQLADFNDGTEAGNRRFYYAPSVALDRQRRLILAIGSGYRARPTETTTEDRFYVFEDPDALSKPATAPSPIHEDDLGNITNEMALTSNKPGWFLAFKDGEKVLAESIIFNGKVVFSTYQPEFKAGSNICNLSGNTPRAYLLALSDGRPLADLDSTTDGITREDRKRDLNSVEFIPGSPYVVFGGGGSAADSGGSSTDETGGNGGGDYTPPPSLSDSASDFATFFVGQDELGGDSALSGRLSWQNH